jgi:hypothetical protein
MNCDEIHELLPDMVVIGKNSATFKPEVEKHLASCNGCATRLREFQKTMALLDEWQGPEPSTYFDTRMQARLREEMAQPNKGWLTWLRRPAWAMSLAAVLFAGALAIGGGYSYINFAAPETLATKPPSLGLPIEPGTAVGDLQALERNDDLYADFDVLDQLQVQDDVTANPQDSQVVD